jgi:hypothetical protein
MQKWMINGLIGGGTVALLIIIISIVTRAPYSFFSTLVYALILGLISGAPGGILLGRIRFGWIWPIGGGLLSAATVGIILRLFKLV